MSYIEEVTAQRQEKDTFFRQSHHSPIPHVEQHTFAGLKYFAPQPDWRVNVTLERLNDTKPLQMATSDGQQQTYVRYALLHFSVDGKPYHLTGYRAPQEHEHDPLFVPFRDALAGKETYGAGRYLEAEVDPHTDTATLDFNLAYNPYCAYNDNYSCPITPAENTLPIPVPAGERVYHE